MNKFRGFTLLELAVSIAIIGILTSLALPAFQGMLADMRVRSTAESFNLGLKLARSEAIKRNSRVSFRFSTAGKWEVCATVSSTVNYTCLDADRVDIKRSAEASQNVVIAPTPTDATMTTFTGLGRQYTDANQAFKNPDATVEVTQVDFSATAASKTYRVLITSAGSIKLCLPSLPAGNAKAC